MGRPIENSGFLAPVVRRDACVGCGLCQTRCYGINVEEKRLLTVTAIRITTDNEDRLTSGSYRALREAEHNAQRTTAPNEGGYLPDFLE